MIMRWAPSAALPGWAAAVRMALIAVLSLHLGLCLGEPPGADAAPPDGRALQSVLASGLVLGSLPQPSAAALPVVAVTPVVAVEPTVAVTPEGTVAERAVAARAGGGISLGSPAGGRHTHHDACAAFTSPASGQAAVPSPVTVVTWPARPGPGRRAAGPAAAPAGDVSGAGLLRRLCVART
ncbi:hypothetical protein [Actinomadura harenae]|uniref:Uncharacterized protein n=1 Tax=Actinomadura harenae TaxID=2483351 RepID=A0A3M2M7H6_9ACTN|nr:hypothetical protein [Actinomadura harenae]RMI45482.1 hypothetical protein EBO15_09735 [Actinomadura harenae]